MVAANIRCLRVMALHQLQSILVNLRSIFSDLHFELVGVELHLLTLRLLGVSARNQRVRWLLAESLASASILVLSERFLVSVLVRVPLEIF